MYKRINAKQRLVFTTALAGVAAFLCPSPAFADCASSGSTINCTGSDADGYQTSTNGITVNVVPGAAVGLNTLTPSPLLSSGTSSVLNNQGSISSAAVAVSLGGGSTVNNLASWPDRIIGEIDFGATGTGQVNTLNNSGPTANILGNIASAGALTVNNSSGGVISGNISSSAALVVDNNSGGLIAGSTITGSDSADSITNRQNGSAGGMVTNISLGAGDDTVSNDSTSVIQGDIDLGTGNNAVTNDWRIVGNIMAGGGNDTLSNAYNITGNVDLGDGNNVISTGPGTIYGNVTTGSGNDTLTNTWPGGIVGNVDLGTGVDVITFLAGTGMVTKSGSGRLTLTGDNHFFNNSGTVISITNGGTVSIGATNNMFTGGITLDGGTIQTTGPLSLDNPFTLNSAGGTFETDADTTLNGSVSGSGALIKSGSANLTLTGTNSYTGGTTIEAGTLTSPNNAVVAGTTFSVFAAGGLLGNLNGAAGSTLIVNGTVTGNVTNASSLSGTGTVNGAVTNSGTLSPGNGGIAIFNVNGSYAQTSTGTLAIQLVSAAAPVAGTHYDQLLVSGTPGTAVLNGTLALSPSSSTLTSPFVDGATYDVVSASGGISGNFSAITGNVVSPFVTLTPTGVVTISGTEQVYRLTVTRTAFATGLGAGATPNQIAVANGFQGLLTGATGDAATLVTAVDNMTVAQAQSFFDQASPEPYGVYATALYHQGELFTRQVALQMHATWNASGHVNVWGRGYGQWGKGRDDSFRFGSDQDVYGGALGVDYSSGGFTVGAAGGYSHDKVDYALGNSDGHVNSWQLGGYLDYAIGGFDFDLQAAYEHSNVSANRSINVTGVANVASIARNASASTSGHLWRVIGTVGYNAKLTDNITARPFIGLDWSDGRLNSFAEAGAGAADLTVDDIRVRRTDVVGGLDVGSKATLGLAPYARLAVKYSLERHNNEVSAFFNGNSATAFTVSAVPLGRIEFDADIGLSYAVNRSFTLFAGYEGTYRKDLHSNGVSAGLRVNFGAPAEVASPPPPSPLPPPPPATQTCPDTSVIDATATCPPPPPSPPATNGERGL
jgi:outer membrane autotransporter protein